MTKADKAEFDTQILINDILRSLGEIEDSCFALKNQPARNRHAISDNVRQRVSAMRYRIDEYKTAKGTHENRAERAAFDAGYHAAAEGGEYNPEDGYFSDRSQEAYDEWTSKKRAD